MSTRKATVARRAYNRALRDAAARIDHLGDGVVFASGFVTDSGARSRLADVRAALSRAQTEVRDLHKGNGR